MSNPTPLGKALQNYIASDSIATSYDSYFAETELFQYDITVLDQCFPKPASMLDIGCGTGRHLIHFAKRAFSVTGVDLSQHMLDLCRAKIQEEKLMARLLQADIRHMEALPDENFHYAICMFSTLGMLHGYDNRLQALKEAHRLLKPEGQLVFHAHSAYYKLITLDGLWPLLKSYWHSKRSPLEFGDRVFKNYRNIVDMFLHAFTVTEIRQISTEAGFKIVKIHYLSPQRNAPFTGLLPNLRSNGFIVHLQKV